MWSDLRIFLLAGFLTLSVLGAAPLEDATKSDLPLSSAQIQQLAESVHETLERENPDLKGVRSTLHRIFSNWNYFRTYVQKMRLAHATNESNPEATKHILNTSFLLLGTHLSEHVIGHGMHYASTFSSNPWIYWSGTIVGEAIASPFVEVVCLAGVCVYARSPTFRQAVSYVRVGAYHRLVKKWAEPFFSFFFEMATGEERLRESLGERALDGNPILLPQGDPLIALVTRTQPNGDVLLESFEAHPQGYSADDWQRLRTALKSLGWNIADGIWSSLHQIKNRQFQMLSSEVFVDSMELENTGKVTVKLKAGALRRTSRPKRRVCAKTIMENSPQ